MTNPFALSEIQGGAPQDAGNPYSLETIQGEARVDLRRSLLGAMDIDPDQAARTVRLSRQVGAPYEAVQANLPEVERTAKLDEYERMLAGAPKLGAFMRNPQNAQIAHDDVGVLSRTENVLQEWAGPAASFSSVISGLAKSLPQGAELARQGIRQQFADLMGFEDMAADARRKYAQADAFVGFSTPAFESSTARGLYSGGSSLIRQLPGLAASILTRSTAPMLATAGIQTEAEAYGKYTGRGATPGQAFIGAAGEGTVEVATEMLPMGFLVEKFGKVGVGKFLSGLLAREIPGEQVATLAQDAIDIAVANPDKTWGEFVSERPDAAYQTLLATLTQTGAMGTVNLIAERAQRSARNAHEASNAAEQNAATLQALAELSQASKLRQRDPAAFEQFITEAADGGPVQQVFIDAKALMQSGVAEQVAAVSPTVANQLQTAVETSGQIAIPVGEYVAKIAPTEYAQSLLDHLKTDPEGFSRAEAQEYMQTHIEELHREVERTLAEKDGDNTFKQSAETVKGEIKGQLDATARFTPQVNDAYAAMVSNFYAVQAAKIGITPEEMFKRYPLKIGAEAIAGQQFEQGGTIEDVRKAWNEAGIKHAISERDGVITVSQIVVPENERGAGKGTAAMQALIDYADRTGQHIALSPSSDFGGNKKRLVQFYKRFGFVENKGKNRAFSTSESMYRQADGKVLYQGGQDIGPFGPVLTDFKGDAQGAIAKLKEIKTGEAIGALNHPDIGDIDLVWGEEGTGASDGYGLAKLAKYHPEVLNDLQGILSAMAVTTRNKNRINLESADHKAAVRLTWDNQAKHWLLTAFRKKGEGGAVDTRTDTADAAGEGDTARLTDASESIVEQKLKEFYQGSSAARGAFNPATLSITLLKNADLSTFLHESGHFFLEVQADLAAQLQKEADVFGIDTLKPGERQILADNDALLRWFGIESLAEWYNLDFEQKRSYHEQFARGFEAYLFEGKAPSIELQGLFQRFRAWLLSVYRELKALNVELTDEVRGVFDRLLATNEQITLAEQGRSMMPLFTSPEQAGMTPEEFAAYQALGVDATAEAIEDLQARGLRDMRWLHNARGRIIKQLQKDAKAQRAAVEMDVRREVMSQPVYRAWSFLTGKAGEKTEAQVEHDKTLTEWKTERADFEQKTRDDLKAKILEANPDAKGIERGQLLAKNKRQIDIDTQQAMLEWDKANQKPQTPAAPAAGETAGGFEFGRLDLVELKAMGLPAEVINAVQARRMTAGNGLHPDIVAEMFGFTSGDELVRKLAEVETPSAEIEALTDVRMLEQYGDLASPEAIEKAADKAIHNDARARFVATEANALAKATGQRKVLASAAKEFARAMIARLKVRNIKPGQYASAEVRAAKAAEQASKAGDLATAAAEKRNQLIQNYATRAAYDAQEEVDKGLRYLKKFEGDIKGLDADYADQIAGLLERFDLRKGQSKKAIDKRAALADWIKAQRDAGLEPDIPAQLENEAFRKSYKDMTVEEFRGLVDTVKQIEHLGRLKHRLLTARDQRTYEAVRDEISASIEQHAQGRQADTRTPTTNMGRALQGLKRFWAAHIKAATLARIMDGGQDGGPMWEHFVRAANERGDMETTLRAEATSKLSEILAPVFKLGKMGGKGQFFPTINRSLNREARIAIALNMGNAGNVQRLLGGEGWTLQQIAPVLQTLTAAEWQAVQSVWDHFESYRPQIAEKERRIYGKEPDWVAPQPFAVTTADGQTLHMRGGYYPIKYDPAASQRAEEHADAESAKRQLQGAYTTATTRRSFTKSRVEEVAGRPLLYTLSGLYAGVNDVIHDLAWHEWLIDTNRLLRSHTIDQAIRDHYGPEAKQQFKTWAADIAEGEKGADAAVDIALSRLRQGVSASGLGFNVMSALIQPLGITQSIVRVGAPWVARGVMKYVAHPIDLTRSVNEMSDFMANRARTRFRELNELRNQVQDQSAFKEIIGRYAYFLMMRCQQMVDVPTWWGAYEKAVGEGNDEARAIALADQAVIDAQGGGQTKDLSAIERGGPAQKLFTVFYSFMNTALNIGVEKTMSADTPAKKAKLAVDYAMLYVAPAVLGYFLKAALTPGDSGDDDLEKIAKKLAANQIDYLMGLMVVVREFGEAAKTVTGANDLGRDYTGPAGLRLIADTVSLAKQAHQGEFDDAFRKAAVNVVGDLFGLPSAQINRTITGTKAIADGKTENPAAIAFGFQEKR